MNIEHIKAKILNDLPDFSGAISVSRKDDVLFEEAFGLALLNDAIPNQLHTKFPMASGSKIFTAAGILVLAEQGRLSLEDSVTMHLKNYSPYMDDGVTIKHLLLHTSGFKDYFDEEESDDFSGIWNNVPMYMMRRPENFLVLLKDNKMEFTPGERFKYNNGGYVILSMLVEKISGVKFTEFIEKHVFDMCGMKDSGYFALNALPKDTAIGYEEDEKGRLVSNIYSIPVIGGGDGGAFTTIKDMRLFWQSLFSGRLLKSPLRDAMISPQIRAYDEGYYGYGVWIAMAEEAVKTLYVEGADPGVSLVSQYDLKDGLIITVLSNRDDAAFQARRIVIDAMKA